MPILKWPATDADAIKVKIAAGCGCCVRSSPFPRCSAQPRKASSHSMLDWDRRRARDAHSPDSAGSRKKLPGSSEVGPVQVT